MKKKQVNSVMQDENTGQYIFIHAISGQLTRGTDWTGERNERDSNSSEGEKEEGRKQN